VIVADFDMSVYPNSQIW